MQTSSGRHFEGTTSLAHIYVYLFPSLLVYASVAGAVPTFEGLGWLSDTEGFVLPTAISGDGSTVVGLSRRTANTSDLSGRVFTWTRAGGMVAVPNSANGWPLAISQDGSVIVGTTGYRSIYVPVAKGAFVWSNGDKTTILATSVQSAAIGVTADGQTVVGASGGSQGWTWQQGTLTSMTGLIAAMGISANGGVIAGNRNSLGSSGQSYSEACLWNNGVITGLGTLGQESPASMSNAISANGEAVVGRSASPTMAMEAFRWSNGTGMVGLGGPAGWIGHNIQSSALDVSADGAVVVGNVVEFTANPVERAIIWDAIHGTRLLSDALVNDYGLDLTGWTLESAIGVSDDGLTIAGSGVGPDGRRQPWVVQLPEPGMLSLAVLAFCLVGRSRIGTRAFLKEGEAQ